MSTTNDHNHDHENLVASNKEHFNKHVHVYDTPDAMRIGDQQARAIREFIKLDKQFTVLDFAGGHGQIARDLIRHGDVKSIVGVDISDEAIKKYNELSIQDGYSPDVIKGVCKELKGEEEELDGTKFDLVICCMAYHHFADCDEITRILTSHLKPNGVLCVIDKYKVTETPAQEYSSEIKKITTMNLNGFTRDEIKPIFEQAGLKEFKFDEAFEASWAGHKFKTFIAQARKCS